MNSAYRAIAVVVVLSVSLSCSNDSTTPSQPVTAVVSLMSPNGDDGAVLVTVTGPGLAAVQLAGSSYKVFWRLSGPEEAHVIVLGNLQSGPLFTVGVGDGQHLSRYRASLIEVASRADQLRPSIVDYHLTLSTSTSASMTAAY